MEIVPGALCRWDAPDGTCVLLNASLIKDLRTRAIEGFVSLPKRGVEIGGILFGQPPAGSVQIEGFEEAPCEHRYGPSYALSDTDRAQLSEILSRRQSDGSLPVIGFFRSFTSRDPLIEAADEEFVRQHFPRGDFLFLMLQPLSPQQCVASFRFFRDGELLPETDAAPIPFDPAKMARVEKQAAATVPPAAAPPPSSVAATEVLPESSLPTEALPVLPPPYRARTDVPQWTEEMWRPRAKSRWWVPAVLCLAAGIGGAVLYQLWMVAQMPRWAELHLDARSAGQQLQVTWDGNTPQALSATRALLSVTDGEAHRDIELTAADIRAGKYAFTPAHADVALRLILYAKGLGVAGDAVRLMPVPNLVEARVEEKPGVPSDPAASAPSRAAVARPPAPAVPPTTIHEVQPAVPEGIRSRIQDRIVIPVEVQVNESGRVTGATAEDQNNNGVHRYLAEQAQKAARQWRFTAARSRTGAKVAATKTVYFVFTP